MNPLVFAGLGLSAVNALRGRHHGQDLAHPDPFQFHLDENDPELAWMRRNILQGGANVHRNTVDELSRAGLLGSGASFGVLGNVDLDTQNRLEGAAGSIYGARRAEAHGDYTSNLNYARGLEDRGYQERAGAFSSIGHLGGSMINDWWRRKLLQEYPESGSSGGGGGGGGGDYGYGI
jgi:hypothetical protein